MPPFYNSPQQSSPTVVDGVVYANALYDGSVAIDAATGVALWRDQFGIQGTPAVSERWMIGSGPFDYTISVIDRTTGRRVRTIDGVTSTAPPILIGDLVVVPTTDVRLKAYSIVTGDLVWSSSVLDTYSTYSGAIAARNRLWTYTSSGGIVGLGAPL